MKVRRLIYEKKSDGEVRKLFRLERCYFLLTSFIRFLGFRSHLKDGKGRTGNRDFERRRKK